MDGVDGNNSVIHQAQSDSVAMNNRDLSDEQTVLTEEQVVAAWTPAVQAVTQAALLYLFPEARRMQQRAEQFNKEIMRDN